MRATVLHRPRDIRCEEIADPKILFPTDAIIKLSATCICGSDLGLGVPHGVTLDGQQLFFGQKRKSRTRCCSATFGRILRSRRATAVW